MLRLRLLLTVMVLMAFVAILAHQHPPQPTRATAAPAPAPGMGFAASPWSPAATAGFEKLASDIGAYSSAVAENERQAKAAEAAQAEARARAQREAAQRAASKPASAAKPAPPAPAPSGGSIASIIAAHFGSSAAAATRVANCESSLNPSAVSPGGGNWGLFQINTAHKSNFSAVTGRPWSDVLDPDANATYAAWLFGRSGWAPWSCSWAA